jgi:hypothetical protein
MAKLKTQTIYGTHVEFEVDSNGTFSADAGEHGSVSGKTLVEVEEKITASLKKSSAAKPVDVTVIGISTKSDRYATGDYSRGTEAIDFTLRGFSDRTRDLLVTSVDGKKQKLGAHPFGEQVCRRFTPGERDQYALLQERLALAQSNLNEFVSERRYDWRPEFNKK